MGLGASGGQESRQGQGQVGSVQGRCRRDRGVTRAETRAGLGTARDEGGAKGWPGTWPTLSICPNGYLGFLKIVLFSPILITKFIHVQQSSENSIKNLNSYLYFQQLQCKYFDAFLSRGFSLRAIVEISDPIICNFALCSLNIISIFFFEKLKAS